MASKTICSAALLALTLAVVAHSARAIDEPGGFTISTGLEGGGYWSAGDRMQAAAAGMGVNVVNQASTGSRINLEKLANKGSPVNLAFAQADALQYFNEGNPYAAPSLEVLKTIGRECVFIISDADGDIESDEDMQDAERMHLGIKSPNSGVVVTFNSMMKLAPELGNVTIIYGDTVERMKEFMHPLTNIDRAVMVVHGTDAHSPEIDLLHANPEEYQLVEIVDERLTSAPNGGEPLYFREKVRPGAAEEAGKVETICVRGLLVANKDKIGPEQREQLNKLLAEHWKTIHPPQ